MTQSRQMSLYCGLFFIAAISLSLVPTAWVSHAQRTPRPNNRPPTPDLMAKRTSGILRNELGMEFVEIPAGTFEMGSSNSEVKAFLAELKPFMHKGTTRTLEEETPQHRVRVSAFYLSKYEVTNAQWRMIMGSNQQDHKGENLPVEGISWNEAQQFISKLNAIGGKYRYRLPSEAEWEYACRADTTARYGGDIDLMAWYLRNSGIARITNEALIDLAPKSPGKVLGLMSRNQNQAHPVGTKEANKFGLYDMYGNVQEWCADWYHENYKGAPADGSAWVSGSDPDWRVLRGGSWASHELEMRSASRARTMIGYPNGHFGVRLVAVGIE